MEQWQSALENMVTTVLEKINVTQALAKNIRKNILHMVHRANASHVGSCLSVADILAVLYKDVLKVSPASLEDSERDRFILSKGHAAAALYATLAELHFFPQEWMDHYNKVDEKLLGHATCSEIPGVEFSTGSLGHGLPVGCGMALAAKMDDSSYSVFVLMSDGECNEGSIWEAALFAHHQKLDNLTVIVDYNKIQSLGFVKDIMELEPFQDKWRSFGWEVKEIDGHDHQMLHESLIHRVANGKPKVFIAHTIKGKGVSFMENLLMWHYKSPTESQLATALKELEATA